MIHMNIGMILIIDMNGGARHNDDKMQHGKHLEQSTNNNE